MNNVTLVGNLVKDPEYGTTQAGVPYCKFTIACQRSYKNQQTGQYDADFISCVAWRQTADFVNKYFIKGNKIGVTGSIQTGSYTAQDGSKRYTTDVAVNNAEFVSAKSESNAGMGTAQETVNHAGYTEVDSDELPF